MFLSILNIHFTNSTFNPFKFLTSAFLELIKTKYFNLSPGGKKQRVFTYGKIICLKTSIESNLKKKIKIHFVSPEFA